MRKIEKAVLKCVNIEWAGKAGRADKEMPRGTLLDVGGRLGVYEGFKRNRVGANSHTVVFDGGWRETVQLKGATWAVLSRPQVEARRRRAGLHLPESATDANCAAAEAKVGADAAAEAEAAAVEQAAITAAEVYRLVAERVAATAEAAADAEGERLAAEAEAKAEEERLAAEAAAAAEAGQVVADENAAEPLTLVSSGGQYHTVPRALAIRESVLLAEMMGAGEDGAVSSEPEVPIQQISAAAAKAFVAFVQGADVDGCGALSGGTAQFVKRWQAAGFLMAARWQQQLMAAWGDALRAQARRGGGSSIVAAAAEAEAVLNPAVSPLLSMLDAGAVALLYHHGGDVAAWAEEELGSAVRLAQGVALVDSAGCGDLPQSTLRHAVVRRGTAAVGDYAFACCNALAQVAIPGSVTSIGDGAFFGCSALAEVAIPGSVTAIGDGAFRECSELAEVTIPGSVVAIDNSTFFGCSALAKVVTLGSVTGIGGCAFYGCSTLAELVIPGSVTTVGYGAFYGVPLPPAQAAIVTQINPEASKDVPWS